MRVLLVTYYFPPVGGGGVQRALGWCRHLPTLGDDVEVTVAAPREPQWVDVDTTLVVPAQVDVIRTPDPSPAAVIPRELLARERGLRRVWRTLQLQPRRFAVPDIHRRWRGPAVQTILAAAAERRHEGVPPWDIVVSTSPPETTHLVARDVARSLGVPWIADLRDSWLDLPHLRLARLDVRLKHARSARLAQRIFADVAAATTVSEPLASDLRQRHPALDVHVLENGVELADVSRARERASGFRDSGSFVIAYTGNFFGRQSAASFLRAAELFLAEVPSARETMVLRFIGGLKAADRQTIDASPVLSGVVDHIDFLRHDDVLAQQAAADLLLLYVAPGVGSAGVYTGKVFEYVASRRPVLALAPADNVATALLAEAGSTGSSGGANVDPDDVGEIAAAIRRAWMSWREAGGECGSTMPDVDVPDALLHRIDRRRSAQQLLELCRTVAEIPS